MSRVVITGCTGSIGISLINKHLSLGDEIYAIVRPDSPKNKNISINENIKIVRCDISELDRLSTFLPTCDYFYHLGWSGVAKNLRNDVHVQLQNIDYTLSAIKLASEIKCQKFIGAGSQAEYGPKDEVITENTKVEPVIGYGIGKYTAGKLGKLYASELGIEFNWTRIFSVYGPYDSNDTMIMSSLNKMLNNESIDLTKCIQKWEYLYSDDCANALYLIAKNGINGETYNISTGASYELSWYILKMKEILNSSSKLNFGAISYVNNQIINLSTDISELKKLGFIPNVSFENGIAKILKSNEDKHENENYTK